jgi:hypothetical protein
MGVWSFDEKSGQGGHVLEPIKMSWPHVSKGRGWGFKNIGGTWRKKGPGPPKKEGIPQKEAPPKGRPAQPPFWEASLARAGPWHARSPSIILILFFFFDTSFFFNKFLWHFFYLFFKRPLHATRAWAFWEGASTAPPFFEACPYTWKC